MLPRGICKRLLLTTRRTCRVYEGIPGDKRGGGLSNKFLVITAVNQLMMTFRSSHSAHSKAPKDLTLSLAHSLT
jgi:hypothetical protein